MENQNVKPVVEHEGENETIIVYWWNLGKKTLDFKGSYKDYLLKRDITVEDIGQPERRGFRFKVSISTVKITMDIFSTAYVECCHDVIKVFFTIMGDRAQIIAPMRNREYNINW